MADEPMIRRDDGVHPPEELALDLSREAVRLVARTNGAWTEVGAVALAAGDFRSGIEALRREAEARGVPEVTLWLPADQIIARRFVLKRGSRDMDEARRRLAAETGRRADELSVAISPAGDGELAAVLGASGRTVTDALDYARRWGFRPGRVSTRLEAERFGAAGPGFHPPEEPRRRGGQARYAVAAAAALLLAGLGAWGAYAFLPGLEPRSIIASAGPLAARAPVAEDAVEAPATATVPAAEGRGRSAREHRAAATERPAGRAGGRLSLPPGQVEGSAPADLPELSAPAADAAAPGQTALERPQPGQAGRLVMRASLSDGIDLAPLHDGIARIRAEGLAPAETGQPAVAEVTVAAADLPPLPVPRPSATTSAIGSDETWPYEPEAEGSDQARPEDMSDSHLAAESAPRPAPRPDRPKRLDGAAANIAAADAPPPVREAAAQHGLALDSTSLIGVIDARSGRQALLRTPSGDYLRVGRGDDVAGWQVNAIGQDAMRLSRGGESRTLLLVTR